MIRFNNTLSGTTEEFKPIIPGKVSMYNCGPTAYGKVHIGNMRAYVFADLIRNILKYNGYEVTQVINITDVGHLVDDGDNGADKVEEQAKRERLDVHAITQKYTDYFMSALTTLGIDSSDVTFPRASDNIPEQIAFIQTLEQKGFAYVTSDGVYFDTAKFPAYGELGHIDIAGLQEGARIEANSEKRNVTDFALWKFSKESRLQEWPSPWGVGFPGWHIECSAMAQKYLGKTFDIHTGGVDHIPTHHNNEIAQSVAAHDAPLANYWLHVNHITIDGKKISKSLGNTVYVEDLEARGISPLAYKYWLYTSHYSTLSNFTWDAVEAAQTALQRLRRAVATNLTYQHPVHIDTEKEDKDIEKYKLGFSNHINDDLNTPKAIGVIWEMLSDKEINPVDKIDAIKNFDKVLKLGLSDATQAEVDDVVIPQEIIELARKRHEARLVKDFALSDALREKITESGYAIKDTDTETGFIIERI
jgi:cysteinyl-tRNA synthetase